MALEKYEPLCKCLLAHLNCLFKAEGGSFFGVGLLVMHSIRSKGVTKTEVLHSDAFSLVVWILVLLGVVMMIVAAFGNYSVCKKKRCNLQVFAVLLAILALAVVVAGGIVFSRSEEVGQTIVKFYNTTYDLYKKEENPAFGESLKIVHHKLGCCGVTGDPEKENLKDWCLKEKSTFHSCPKFITDLFKSKAPLVLLLFLGTAVVLIAALVCSIILLKQTKADRQGSSGCYSGV